MDVEEILAAFGSDERPQSAPVEKEEVRRWMTATDADVLGLVFRYLGVDRYSARIRPNVNREEYFSFATKYLKQCLLENPQGLHAHNRYEAGWEIAGMFSRLWEQGVESREDCARLKRWIEDLVIAGDSDVRLCLVNATLEHLFENSEIAKFFGDWLENAALAATYSEAILWRSNGGASPIGSGNKR